MFKQGSLSSSLAPSNAILILAKSISAHGQSTASISDTVIAKNQPDNLLNRAEPAELRASSTLPGQVFSTGGSARFS